MDVKELHKFIRKHVKINNAYSVDAKTLAESLGIVVKDSSECLNVFGVEKFPLNEETQSVYVFHNFEHIIYYNEKHENSNFSIATMIVAQLGWYHLGEVLSIELCRLGATMLLVPKFNFADKDASLSEIADKFKIPLPYIRQYKIFLENNTMRHLFTKIKNVFKEV